MLRDRTPVTSSVFVLMVSIAAIAQTGDRAPVRQLHVNGVDLSYLEEGRGTPVVFVHGAACDLRYWEPQRAAFAREYRFIAYSHRYHGTGPWPDDGKLYFAETHAADLAAFISGLKAGPVHLVGLSYGGLVAAMAAIKEPGLVRTLTLAEPSLFSVLAEAADGKQFLGQWNKDAEPMVAAIKAGDYAGATRHLTALVTGGRPEDFDRMPAPLRELLLDNARTLPLLLAGQPPNVTCERLRGIKAPTLVVRGERTPPIFSRTNEEVGKCIAGSRLVTIPNASHPMSYDNPVAFNDAVLAFLAKSPADPSREIER
jgi:pimeloyl-ACP methyl ester carboxylesterase